ncbi:M48 family metallopeptidase [Trichlorobacter ammonificans]|uniref:Predicted metal-dependent hydrolase n=1 Tax=Trichlorobacter ammonificans TaxID=2916410 RepID=A0ABN8HB46_9BACT|nr:SprT family zinc-dependent metalloprotease [Trichlorobacter ammonificans]CAH2029882.1 Putative predicted metal-dependent hydrolase [Trichlorobacter ammonificans]
MNSAFGTIKYGREQVQFNVLYSARKTLGIEVYPDSSVVVKAPLGIDSSEVQRRVFRRVRWIVRQQRYFRQFDPRTPVRQFVGGETHLYLGRQFRLAISSGNQDSVKLTRGYFTVAVRGTVSSDKVKSLLDSWYAAKATAKFEEILTHRWPHFEKLGLSKPRMQTKYLKKRWGSLSRNGLLTLNTDLIRAPKECIDYVITHELCHLQYHDHSAEFYRLLEKVLPDWEKRKHKLELTLA